MKLETLIRKIVRQCADADYFTLVPESRKFILVSSPYFSVTPSMVESALDPELYKLVRNITLNVSAQHEAPPLYVSKIVL